MHSKGRIVAIIQARFGSTRLPGKVLRDILGKPMLGRVIERLKISQLIDEIVVATTKERNKAILRIAHGYGVKGFVGSEDDVLDRYYQAAKRYKANVIVRITGDCPLIDTEVVDKVVECYIRTKDIDFACNIMRRSYPRGLDTEVFSFNVLKRVWQEAKESYQREHVTPYIYEHSKMFHLANIENNEDLSYMRWTVDEERDMEFVREIYGRLYRKEAIFLMKDVLNILAKEPQLVQINEGVIQEASAEN